MVLRVYFDLCFYLLLRNTGNNLSACALPRPRRICDLFLFVENGWLICLRLNNSAFTYVTHFKTSIILLNMLLY